LASGTAALDTDEKLNQRSYSEAIRYGYESFIRILGPTRAILYNEMVACLGPDFANQMVVDEENNSFCGQAHAVLQLLKIFSRYYHQCSSLSLPNFDNFLEIVMEVESECGMARNACSHVLTYSLAFILELYYPNSRVQQYYLNHFALMVCHRFDMFVQFWSYDQGIVFWFHDKDGKLLQLSVEWKKIPNFKLVQVCGESDQCIKGYSLQSIFNSE
jgi:hypothetical protein